MKIEITVDDIALGQRLSCLKCPIALAMKRKTNKFLAVLNTAVRIEGSSYLLPTVAQQFIVDFDSGCRPVGPFSFELEVKC